MKHKFTKEECSRGGINAYKNHSQERKKQFSIIADRSGKGSIIRGKEERSVIERITKDYDDIFAPNAVCDKIAFKDDKVIFIEIKRNGQKLRNRQEKFKNIIKEQYIIEYV